jgi:hypothetical protein
LFLTWVSYPKSVFKDQEAVKCLSSLHDKCVIVPADKASNNIVFVCKSYYFECLIKELGKSPFGDSHVEWYSDHQWLHVQMGCIEKESGSSHKSESS